jgi:hypothetical protein
MFGKGMIKKVFMYLMLGASWPIVMMLGGNFNIMDLLLIPMIAGIFGPMLGGLGLGNLLGGGAPTPGATT